MVLLRLTRGVIHIHSEEEAFRIIEETLKWYTDNGQGRERIGASIARLGLEKYLEEVIEPLGVEMIVDASQRRKYWAGGNFYES